MSSRAHKSRLRIAYVGPGMDLAMAAYAAVHVALHHEVDYFPGPDQVPRAPSPDVVFIAPLPIRNGRIEGPCLVSGLVPSTTLIVALATTQGHSHAMFVKHALGGRCHQRILVHYPRPGFTAEDLVSRVDAVARQEGPTAGSLCGVPDFLDLREAKLDLGQIMEDQTLSDFLYVAATDPDWSSWKELAELVGYSEGTVKNRMSTFGKKAEAAGLIPPRDPDGKYRIGAFLRYITEHRSFIRAHAQHGQHSLTVLGGEGLDDSDAGPPDDDSDRFDSDAA